MHSSQPGGIYKATKPASDSNTKAYESMNPAKWLALGKGMSRCSHCHFVFANVVLLNVFLSLTLHCLVPPASCLTEGHNHRNGHSSIL